MSAVLTLQKNIISRNKPLNDLLREALLIATKLNLNDFNKWISSELKGYSNEEIPDYRKLRTSLKFFNPYHGWIPAIVKNEKLDNTINETSNGQSISELEHLCLQDNKEFTLGITGKQKALLMETFATDNEPAQFVSKVQLVGILDHVKTLLLEWALKLEQEGILGDDNMIFTNDEKEKAMQTIHIGTINGAFGNIEALGNISTGNNSTNTANIDMRNEKIEKLIQTIKHSSIADKEQIIADIESTRHDKTRFTEVLGNLLTRASEVGSIVQFIKDII